MTTKRDLEFVYEIGCLRFLQRTWQRFLNPDFQNLSEHTLRVAWLALILAKHEKVRDQEKILKMALVHDLSESRTGDVDYLSRQYTKRDEEKATKDILKNTALDKEMIKIWQEYEKLKSKEAKIVKDADTLDIDLELQEQKVRGHKIRDIWKKMRKEVAYGRFYTKTAKKFWQEIQNSNPHDWHWKGRNRFNSGDWKSKR